MIDPLQQRITELNEIKAILASHGGESASCRMVMGVILPIGDFNAGRVTQPELLIRCREGLLQYSGPTMSLGLPLFVQVHDPDRPPPLDGESHVLENAVVESSALRMERCPS